MNKISFVLLAATCIPLFAEADAVPVETNYCAGSAAGFDNAAQTIIAAMCGAGFAMKAAIAKYQPDPASQGGSMGGMAGGLGSLFGGSSKPALPPAAPVNASNAAPASAPPAPAQPAPASGSAAVSIYK